MNLDLGPDYAAVMLAIGVFSMLLTAIVHIAFAVAVFLDGSGRRPTGILPVSPFMSALATLLGGDRLLGRPSVDPAQTG
jgi:hypothetical protein